MCFSLSHSLQSQVKKAVFWSLAKFSMFIFSEWHILLVTFLLPLLKYLKKKANLTYHFGGSQSKIGWLCQSVKWQRLAECVVECVQRDDHMGNQEAALHTRSMLSYITKPLARTVFPRPAPQWPKDLPAAHLSIMQ